jgi:hypothetical protein
MEKGKGGPRQQKGSGKGKGYNKGGRKGLGKGKGARKGKGGAFRTSDGYRVRRNGGIQKRRSSGNQGSRNSNGKGGAKGGARALAIATRGMQSRSDEYYEKRSSNGGNNRISPEETKMMKNIQIVAKLDSVPKPSPAMEGMWSRGRGSERTNSLSRRFSNSRR